ncbi:hypothetical protein SISSUDRAFT_1061745 [Sistotremastrum suecicum HHB10207 ss-3]|uniref:Ribosome 60S biogenesis N-terminal-domain-containing protein n=1 Tax=Sistotremastrum suecicum HHB10207 ss-3 TaxID=1314776 RepID=A0A166DMX8_9AGAM|nr:hypothetical protein SISSUDRAFT_1061745 [Sistotremastrum suecicum HHB10207 ss-3]
MAKKRKAETEARSPQKKARVEETSVVHDPTFLSPQHIQNALAEGEQDALDKHLVALRNQLTVRATEGPISTTDKRVALVSAWIGISPGLPELFKLVEVHQRNANTLALILSIFAYILQLLSSHLSTQATGSSLTKILLSSLFFRRYNAHLSGGHNELIMATLKLLTALSTFAGCKDQKVVLDGFAWGSKAMPKLLYARRKVANRILTEGLPKPDIRTLYIKFILSFVSPSSSTSIKSSLLEHHSDALSAIFKGLMEDPYDVARWILESCWEGIWMDAKLKRTLKLGAFHNNVLLQIMKLYDRVDVELDSDPESTPADLVHHFMLGLCTRVGFGLCFKSNGWYPRETDSLSLSTENEEEGEKKAGAGNERIFNKPLSNLLRTLRPGDSRQQELIIKILEAAPELISRYWRESGLVTEPRLSSKWFANLGTIGSIVSLPIPSTSFFSSPSPSTPTKDLEYKSTPPPLSSILENILPSILTRANLTKGLQHPSALVRHSTALLLSKCLAKFGAVIEALKTVEEAVEGTSASSGVSGIGVVDGEAGESEGLWEKRRMEVEREIALRVPAFSVIVAFSQSASASSSSSTTTVPTSLITPSTSTPADTATPTTDKSATGEKGGKGGTTRSLLLSEAALRVIWLYHVHLPDLVSEVKFDAGKLLGMLIMPSGSESHPHSILSQEERGAGLDKIRELHILRIMKESQSFTWSNKLGTTNHSYLYHIFTLYNHYSSSERFAPLKNASYDLLGSILANSILFEHDPEELGIWLEVLPTSRPSPATNDAQISGGGEAGGMKDVLEMLDDCILRCMKTPYRYIEESLSATRSSPPSPPSPSNANAMDVDGDVDGEEIRYQPHELPSPLLLTLLEQLTTRISKRLISPSSIIALFSFVRGLVILILGKQPDLVFARNVHERLARCVQDMKVNDGDSDGGWSEAIVVGRKERDLLGACIEGIEKPIEKPLPGASASANEFFPIYERRAIGLDESGLEKVTYELVDRVKVLGESLSKAQVRRVVGIVKPCRGALRELMKVLDPRDQLLWDAFKDVDEMVEYKDSIPFEYAFIHSNVEHLNDSSIRSTLATLFLSPPSTTTTTLLRRLNMVLRRLASAHLNGGATKGMENVTLVTRIRYGTLATIVEIMDAARKTGSVGVDVDVGSLKKGLYEGSAMRDVLRMHVGQKQIREVLEALFRVTLDCTNDADRVLVAAACDHWLHSALSSQGEDGTQIQTLLLFIPFMEDTSLFRLLDLYLPLVTSSSDTSGTPSSSSIVSAIFSALTKYTTQPSLAAYFKPQIPTLFKLIADRPEMHELTKLLSAVMCEHLPLICAGVAFDKTRKFTDVNRTLESFWNRQTYILPPSPHILSLLTIDHWDTSRDRLVAYILYFSPESRKGYSTWLQQNDVLEKIEKRDLIASLSAWLDMIVPRGIVSTLLEPLPSEFVGRLLAWLTEGFLADASMENGYRSAFGTLIRVAVTSFTPDEFRDLINRYIKSLHSLAAYSLITSVFASQAFVRDFADKGVVDLLVEGSLSFVTRAYSDGDEDEDVVKTVQYIVNLVKASTEVKPHVAEPMLQAMTQNSLSSPPALELAAVLVARSPLKPASVNKLIQSIVQHRRFKIIGLAPTSRLALIKLLDVLFRKHPLNTCQPSHVQPLVSVYHGTLSEADTILLSIFQLFETERRTSIASLFLLWSPSRLASGSASPDSITAILTNLDSNMIFRTLGQFPCRRTFQSRHLTSTSSSEESNDDIYDPVFLLLLLGQFIIEAPELNAFQWVDLLRTNIACIPIICLASKDASMRTYAHTMLGGLWTLIKNADFQEKDQVTYSLNMMKDGFAAPWDTVARQPTHIALLMAHAIRAIFYPGNFLSPSIFKFLLQRPELDLEDIPMLLGMLYSSSDDSKKEKSWIIRFLKEGMKSTKDWTLLQRRRTVDMLCTVFEGSRDSALRAAIIEVFAAITSNASAATTLVLRSSFLVWIEMQMETISPGEELLWAQVFENISYSARGSILQRSTHEQWQFEINRCLRLLLRGQASIDILSRVANILLALSQIASPESMEPTLDLAMKVLKGYESSVMSPLSDVQRLGSSATAWFKVVESLWRCESSRSDVSPRWRLLVSRILLWRSYSCSIDGTEEWVRQEALVTWSTSLQASKPAVHGSV